MILDNLALARNVNTIERYAANWSMIYDRKLQTQNIYSAGHLIQNWIG